MKRLISNWPVMLLLSAAAFLGCNQSTPTPPVVDLNQTGAGTVATVTAPRQVPMAASPDQVVSVFRDAMRSGDAPTVDTLLTSKAREETRRHQMPVEPMADRNAQFQ